MSLSNEEIIYDVFEKIEHSKDYYIKIEIDKIFYDLTKKYALATSYKFQERIRRAYEEDRESLRKAMTAIILYSNSYFLEQVTKYPSLKEEYEAKIAVNNGLIERLQMLW